MLLTTFTLTIVADLTVAIAVGVALALLFRARRRRGVSDEAPDATRIDAEPAPLSKAS